MSIRIDSPTPPKDAGDSLLFGGPVDVWDHIDIAMVRDRPEWVIPRSGNDLIRVQLGAGKKLIHGWDNLDYPQWDAESWRLEARVHDGSQRWKLPYEDASVAEIACYHTLDHLTPESVVRTLDEVQRVLVSGGIFTHIVPHYLGQLANECLMHRSRWAVDTFRNIFSERQYNHRADGVDAEWNLEVGHNFIYGITERNLVLVTQLVRK